MLRRIGLAASALSLALCAACSGGGPGPALPTDTTTQRTDLDIGEPTESLPPAPEVTVGKEYVALGDSSSAAPGVPPVVDEKCNRSGRNYPKILAETEGLTLTDVTCTGATTDMVLTEQIPKISKRTELVTVAIGGNDFDLFNKTIAGCVDLAVDDPLGSPCLDRVSAQQGQLDDAISKVGDHIGRVLDDIAAAAPDARIIVVGYVDLLPEDGSSCQQIAPFAVGDYPFVNSLVRAIAGKMSDAANARGLTFVDLQAPSQGHDICSDDPWTNGKDVAPDGTIPYHPLAEEQVAVADLIATALKTAP